MTQHAMLAIFATLPPEKLPKVVAALNAQIAKLAEKEPSRVQVTFMQASHDGVQVIRAQISSEDFAAAEHMSDTVEKLFSQLGGVVEERLIAG